MGRSINFYVIPTDIKHDTTREFCFEWEYQLDEEDVENEIYNKVHPNEEDILSFKEGLTREEMVAVFKERKQKRNNVLYENLYSFDKVAEIEAKWCPKCLMFAQGLYSSNVLLAHKTISHSYSNPIWNSNWNIRDLWLGTSNTPFVNKFRNDVTYRQIFVSDVENAIDNIRDLGEPLRNSDKEAHEETMCILNFLLQWTHTDNVEVIVEDE